MRARDESSTRRPARALRQPLSSRARLFALHRVGDDTLDLRADGITTRLRPRLEPKHQDRSRVRRTAKAPRAFAEVDPDAVYVEHLVGRSVVIEHVPDGP